MYWHASPAASGSEAPGLTLTVEAGYEPGLVLEYGGTKRIRLRRGGATMLWARVEAGYTGVWLVRRNRHAPPGVLPHIRASEVRSMEGAEQWMRWAAQRLAESDVSPLRPGTWQLTELRPAPPTLPQRARDEQPDVYEPADPDRLPAPAHRLLASTSLPPAHFEKWGINGSGGVFPLRNPSPVDAARVKAWRKRARDGTLPPVFLWWVGPFDVHLVIDGHDRLVAAAAEGMRPAAIVLWQPLEEAISEPAQWRDELVRTYERAFASKERLSDGSRKQLNKSLVEAFRGWRRIQTTARARPGLDEEWASELRAELSADPELADRVCG